MSTRPALAYFPHVDGLRAVAVLAVVLYHLNSAWLPGGFAGVDIFFVISGFIVSASVATLPQGRLGPFLAHFYARRIQRIAPALIVCLLVTALATAIFIPPVWLSDANQRTGLFAFFGLSNFILARTNNDYFSPLTEFNPYTHTWSLGVEEQFYFIFPLLFFAWTLGRQQRVPVAILFGVALLASLGYSAWLGATDRTAAFYMITSRFWQLASGVLLYQLMILCGRRFDIAVVRSSRGFTVLGVAGFVAIAYGLATATPAQFPFPGALPTVLGTLAVLLGLHGKGPDNALMRVLGSRAVLYVGRISYSLYLWHWPVIVLLRWTIGVDTPATRALALILSVALAVASYHWVETPMRRLRVARTLPRGAVVAGGLVLVGAAAVAGQAIHHGQPRLTVSTVSQHAADWYPYGSNHHPDQPDCSIRVEAIPLATSEVLRFTGVGCTVDPDAPRLVAIGDSHAIGYEALYKAYALTTGRDVLMYRNGGCPFLSLQPWREDSALCVQSSAAALADLKDRLQPGDALLLASLRLPRLADAWTRMAHDDVERHRDSDWAREQRAHAVPAARTVLQQLAATGANILLEAPKPIFKSPAFRCAETWNATNGICRDGLAMDRDGLLAWRAPIVAGLAAAVDGVPHTVLWDPFPVLCPEGSVCEAVPHGRPLFFDADHLSGHGNAVLLPDLRRAIAALQQEASASPPAGMVTSAP